MTRKHDRVIGIVEGIGINDILVNGKLKPADLQVYRTWKAMLARCCNARVKRECPSSQDSTVATAWLRLSVFKRWFDRHYVAGHALDKDILCSGNKMYSSATCCFVPPEINALMYATAKAEYIEERAAICLADGEITTKVYRALLRLAKRMRALNAPQLKDKLNPRKKAQQHVHCNQDHQDHCNALHQGTGKARHHVQVRHHA